MPCHTVCGGQNSYQNLIAILKSTSIIHIGCSFEFVLKVGVEESIVNVPLVKQRKK
jgi:hypothetical protein